MTNELSKSLQRKDQDIVNAKNLVKLCKQQIQMRRESEWDSFLDQVSKFCEKHGIVVPVMEDAFVPRGKSRRKAQGTINLHYFHVELFYLVIDMQLQELNDWFNEVNTYLLLFVSCLCPSDSFIAFNKQKLIRLATFYPDDFSSIELMVLDDQFDTYLMDMGSSEQFLKVKSIRESQQKWLKQENKWFSLILPVATTTLERVFSVMKIVYTEKDIFNELDNEVIMQQFQKMKARRGQL